jgi:hypothetical protein
MRASVTIEYFCEEKISIGDPMEWHITDHPVKMARKYRGGQYVGISLNSVVKIDFSKERLKSSDEVAIGSKIAIASAGCELVLPIVGKTGDFIRPRKDGTWKIGCKSKRAVGQIMSCNGVSSRVKLC